MWYQKLHTCTVIHAKMHPACLAYLPETTDSDPSKEVPNMHIIYCGWVGEWVSGKPSSSYSDLTKVCVTINGSPNMLHSNGIESTDMLEAASGFFVKEKKIALSIGICKSSTPKKRSDLSPTPSSTWAYSWILCSINSSSTTKSLQYPLLRSHRGAY